MESIEIDPPRRTYINAYEAYRLDSSMHTVPFVFDGDLTLRKSKEKYFEEFRLFPEKFRKTLDEKTSTPTTLNPPIELKKHELYVYLKESSSQHMSTIIEEIEDHKIPIDDVDFLVTSNTLNQISGVFLNRQNSWRLRAYREISQGKSIIVLCDDDFQKIDFDSKTKFLKERNESLSFAHQLTEHGNERIANPHLCGSRIVTSSLRIGESTVRLAVAGEIDMVFNSHSVNTVITNGRTNRMSLGFDEDSSKDFEYIWSRNFWLGMVECLVGRRYSPEDPVERMHRLDLENFYSQHRRKCDNSPDLAVNLVAHTLICLREMVKRNPNSNWIIEYKGVEVKTTDSEENFEPGKIKMTMAEESFSFWLIREYFHITKHNFISEKLRQMDDARKKELAAVKPAPKKSSKIRKTPKKSAKLKIKKPTDLNKDYTELVDFIAATARS